MTKTQKLQAEKGMLELEITALKMELLTKDEKIAIQDEQISKMAKELDTTLSAVLFESKLKNELHNTIQVRTDFFDKANTVSKENIRQLEVRLNKIPKWIQWIFN